MGLFKKKGKKTKDLKRNEMGTISGDQVTIKIFRDFGSNVNQRIAKFYANEVKDGYGGLLFSNQSKDFSEEVEFQKDDIYREMKVLLDIRNLSKENQLKSIKKKIDKQRKILAYLDRHVILNGTYNYIDEKLKLRDYNLLYNHINNINETMGSFFVIEGGKRVYSFVSKDGFLYPIWHGVDHYTSYPDYVRKHKIKNKEDEVFKFEWGAFFKDNMPVMSVIVIIAVFGLLTMGNMYWTYQNYQASHDMDLIAQRGAIECQNTASLLTSNIIKLLDIKVIQKAIEGSVLIPDDIQNSSIVSLN